MNASSEDSSAPSARLRKPRRLASLSKNLTLSAVTLLLCVALTEVVLRLMGYGNLEIYEPDPVLFWKLKPNQDCFTKVDRKPVHINSRGTRGPEFAVPKPAGALRIVSLGDSKTFGWGLAESETYSSQLERLLRERFPGRHIEVINAGVNAWSYAQMGSFFRRVALAWQPDFVILADANLWTQFSEQADPQFVKSFLSRVRLKNYLRRFALYHYVIEVKLKDVYQRYRTRFIPVDPQSDPLFPEQQQKDPGAFYRQHITSLCETARTNRVRPVIIYIPILDDPETSATASIRGVKSNVCQRLNVPFLDLSRDLKPGGKALYLEADPVHLNSAGNEIVARRLFEQLIRVFPP